MIPAAATTGDVVFSSPAVANDVVYVGSNDHKLYAFSAPGTTNCSGTPKVCSPLWTAATGAPVQSSPALANGVVYIGSLDGKLYAFDAAGTSGCSGSPKTCAPLLATATGLPVLSSPAVANGMVYAPTSWRVYGAFSLVRGVIGCPIDPSHRYARPDRPNRNDQRSSGGRRVFGLLRRVGVRTRYPRSG